MSTKGGTYTEVKLILAIAFLNSWCLKYPQEDPFFGFYLDSTPKYYHR